MFKQLVLLIIVIGAVFFILTYVWQRNLIYFPMHQTPIRTAFQAESFQDVEIKTADELMLTAWYRPAREDKPTILYLHGNAGHIGYRVQLVQDYLAEGFGVFLLEYRGYGGNPGKPTESGLYHDGRAALNYLHNHGVPAKHVVLFGESLGAGVAVQLATERPVCAVILQSPFTSLSELARYHYPWAILKPWDRFESLEKMNSINAPLLILHGQLDRIVPFSQGKALYEAANQPKKMIAFEKGDHNTLWSESDFYQYVIDFINSSCK